MFTFYIASRGIGGLGGLIGAAIGLCIALALWNKPKSPQKPQNPPDSS